MATLDDLLSVLQGASNSAASTVSAPVDGINWLLKKAGVPVSDKPVGGSDWLKDKGLMAEPQNQNLGYVGEAIGGVLPMVAAAKTPQIASALNQMGANMAAPRMLNPQAGVLKISDAERAQRMADMGMERGWFRGGPKPNNAGNRTGPWYTQDVNEAAGYAANRGGDVREYAIPKSGFFTTDGRYPHQLPNDVAKIISDPYYGAKGASLAKELNTYGPGEGITGGQLWQALKANFGNDDAAQVLEKLGKFKGAKGITHGPEAYVFKSAPVRDAEKAAFNLADYGKDDIYGKVNLPVLGLLGGTALLGNHLLRKD